MDPLRTIVAVLTGVVALANTAAPATAQSTKQVLCVPKTLSALIS
jgi:hypothetical protein